MAAVDPSWMKVGDDLYVATVQGSALKEQDLNAQVMDTTRFERLVENVRQRGALESLPYCHQPNGEGPISIVSGHHRAKAARMAGLKEFSILVDTKPMSRSLVRAKQIAHNELTGSPDEELLRRMIEEIDDVEDLLHSGLPEEYLPAPEKSPTALDLPHAEFDWRMVMIAFLPEQLTRFDDLLTLLGNGHDVIGVAQAKQFEQFSKAAVAYGQAADIKNMAAIVDALTQVALRELARIAEEAEGV